MKKVFGKVMGIIGGKKAEGFSKHDRLHEAELVDFKNAIVELEMGNHN